MLDLTVTLIRLLNGIAYTDIEFPDADAKMPRITLTEISNITDFSVDGKERISEITYQVDVWDRGDCRQEAERIAAEACRVLTQQNYTRVMGRSMRDPSGLQRKTMYFRGYFLEN